MHKVKSLLLVCLSGIANILMAQPGAVNNEIDLISDTQQPLALEKLRLHANHNIKATSLLLADILQQKPLALYMLGDVVALGSSHRKWHAMPISH